MAGFINASVVEHNYVSKYAFCVWNGYLRLPGIALRNLQQIDCHEKSTKNSLSSRVVLFDLHPTTLTITFCVELQLRVFLFNFFLWLQLQLQNYNQKAYNLISTSLKHLCFSELTRYFLVYFFFWKKSSKMFS